MNSFLEHPRFKQITLLVANVRGGAYLLAGRLSFVASTFAFNLLAARCLPAAELGILLFLQGLAAVVGMTACFQAGQAATQRLVGTTRSEMASILSSAQWLGVWGGAVSGAGVATYLLLYPPAALGVSAPEMAVATSIFVFCFSIRAVVARCLISLSKMKAAAILDGALGTVVSLFLLAVLAMHGDQVRFSLILFVMVVGYAIEAVASLVMLQAAHKAIVGTVRTSPSRRLSLIRAGLLLTASTLVTQLALQVPVWFLVADGNSADAGSFGLAFRLSNLVGVFILVVNQAATPRLAELIASGDHTRLHLLLNRLGLLLFAAAVLYGAPLLVWPASTLSILFGSPYASGSTALVILVIAQIIEAAAGPSQLVTLLRGRLRASFIIIAATCVLTPVICLMDFASAQVVAAISLAIPMSLRATVFYVLSRHPMP